MITNFLRRIDGFVSRCGVKGIRRNQGQGGISFLRSAVIISLVLSAQIVSAQEALRNSIAGEAASESRRLNLENMPYTYKNGDFRALVSPSLGLDWNDNIQVSETAQQQDFILRPMLGLDLSYPLTQHNLLELDTTFGYSKYLQHDDLSTWSLGSGSALSFDVSIKDVLINFHDRFSYTQDSAQQAAIANTGSYGTFNNSAGVDTTWDMNTLTLGLNYDHANTLSTSKQFNQVNHTSDSVVPRAGYKVNPRLTAGVEGSVSSTAYDQQVLNNNTAYSAGVYADWRPGLYFRLQPRAGYSISSFQQTSASIKAQDQGSWYADVTLQHDISKLVSYNLSAGHEIQGGIQADTIENWYLRPGFTLNFFKDVSLNATASYEHGSQSQSGLKVVAGEVYDAYGGSLGLGYSIMKKLSVSLNYRVTLRSSSLAGRNYTQNMVGLLLSYHL